MDFEELVTKISNITGLNLIQSSRLLAANIMYLTGDMVTATFADIVPSQFADMFIEWSRESAADNLELTHAE